MKQYINNLEKSEISLWEGTLDLKNVILNEETIDYMVGLKNLNLRLSSSHIDKITISIPIMDFMSKPIDVKVNALYATLNFLKG